MMQHCLFRKMLMKCKKAGNDTVLHADTSKNVITFAVSIMKLCFDDFDCTTHDRERERQREKDRESIRNLYVCLKRDFFFRNKRMKQIEETIAGEANKNS